MFVSSAGVGHEVSPGKPWDTSTPRPVLSLLLIALSLLMAVRPEVLNLLCFDQGAIRAGEWWRLLTGHFVHSSFSHAGWDLLVFGAVAIMLEKHSRPLLVWATMTGLGFLNLWLLSPWSGLEYYCGLSGLLFAPLMLLCLQILVRHKSIHGALPLLVCVGKLCCESLVQSPLMVDTQWQVYTPAHVVGAIAGITVFTAHRLTPGVFGTGR